MKDDIVDQIRQAILDDTEMDNDTINHVLGIIDSYVEQAEAVAVLDWNWSEEIAKQPNTYGTGIMDRYKTWVYWCLSCDCSASGLKCDKCGGETRGKWVLNKSTVASNATVQGEPVESGFYWLEHMGSRYCGYVHNGAITFGPRASLDNGDFWELSAFEGAVWFGPVTPPFESANDEVRLG